MKKTITQRGKPILTLLLLCFLYFNTKAQFQRHSFTQNFQTGASATGQLILELPELNYSYLNGLIEGIYLVQLNLENNETHNIKIIVTK